MALTRRARRWAVTLIVVGIGGFAATKLGMVEALHEALYPSDPTKRQALELCFMQDHKFSRLDADAREACYHRMLSALGDIPAADVAAEQPTANLVDLERSAGAGSQPRNDIRRLEQNENAAHSPH
jgi:hypothetical protein